MKACKYPVRFSIFEWARFLASMTLLVCLLTLGYYFIKSDDPPVVMHGYRIGLDNTVFTGQLTTGLILLERDITRKCRTHVTFTTQEKKQWPGGTLYDLMAPDEAVKAAHAATPGEFYFRFRLPKDAPTGPMILHGEAEFWCEDNPWHRFFPARISAAFPITVLD